MKPFPALPLNADWKPTSKELVEILQLWGIGCWVWNALTQKEQYDATWKSQLGYSQEECGSGTALTWEELLHPNDRYPALTRFNKFKMGHTKTYDSKFRLRHKNGSYIYIHSRAMHVEWETPYSVSGIVRPVPIKIIGGHMSIPSYHEPELSIKS